MDDDKTFCQSLADYLRSATLEVLTAHTAEDGLDICSQTRVDVVLLDQKLPDRQGHTLCPSILNCNDHTKIVFTTAYPSFENAVRGIRAGAYDYLSKPFELEELRLTVTRALRTLELELVEQFQNYKSDKEMKETALVGSSEGLAEVRRLVDAAAEVDAPVLITGETGSGKNVVAKAIHFRGPLRKAPFISINCAALPENLVEAELFGYDKGAFTGAVAARKGIFEMAEGGTLFLDEIGEMPLHLQSKLLGVLDDKKIRRLGGESVRYVDVRIIAATSADIEESIRQKRFRQDLFYRLSVIKIHVPPLRDRRQDIPDLCRFLLKKAFEGREILISDFEIERLMEYEWAGNVRELKNVIERASILQKGPYIRPSELLVNTPLISATTESLLPACSANSSLRTLDSLEESHIRHVLSRYSGNQTRAAKAIGISLSTLKRKIKKYGIIPTR
ncbi:MAG TPA: sigma-54 dependent transcriptional regulator [Thermodesulfovibrionales bacterium]|nr:sigma-54 dependent transcriptional regulator [Thermodesulfovibrionales bacterium]